MQIKIFFGHKPIYLCNKLSKELQEITHHPETIYVDEASKAAINSLLHEIKKPAFTVGIICAPDIDEIKKLFFKQYTVIEAAGGIVQNQQREILFIYRKDKWDLPKGKIEKGESLELAAEREIKEETGVTDLILKKKIHTTYHIYKEFGKEILKVSHWFYFISHSKQILKPQTEEEITEVKWIATKDIKVPMANSYENIKELMHHFFDTP